MLIKTSQWRAVHGLGGMASYVHIRNDDTENQSAMEQVRTNKKRK